MSEENLSDWEESYISDHFELWIGGTPSRSNDTYWDEEKKTDNKWVSIRDINHRYISETEERISDLGVTKSSVKLIPRNTVIMSFKLTIGRLTITKCPLYTNEAIVSFIPKTPNSVDTDYLYYGLQSWNLVSEVDQAVKGATLNKDKMSRIFGLFPPLPEQKKIASILTSVDEVIETTQKQIDKLQDLKKATMNELLTKGIGHTEFKDSELGRIPKSWVVEEIGKLTEFVTSGSRGWSQYYSPTGSLFIRIGNLTRDHINLKFEDIQLVDPPEGGEGTRTKVKLGDILVSITADLGVIGVVNEGVGEAYVNQHVCLVRLAQKKEVLPRWIGHFLSGHEGQEQFSKKNDGGAKAGLNLPTIRSVLVPIPLPNEQDQIVHILDRLDSDISVKQRKLERHQSLKKSLMQDLLTGKVRVQVN